MLLKASTLAEPEKYMTFIKLYEIKTLLIFIFIPLCTKTFKNETFLYDSENKLCCFRKTLQLYIVWYCCITKPYELEGLPYVLHCPQMFTFKNSNSSLPLCLKGVIYQYNL